MKVFVCWSGRLSLDIAIVLRKWLPSVLQSLDPYVSEEDIDKGTRWSTDLSKELEASSYGILCITQENISTPWLNFEAGALSKSVDQSRVAPFLFGLKRSEVKGPLLQFQSTVAEREDVLKLVHSLNNAEEAKSIEDARLDEIFEVWWPKLEESLGALDTDTGPKHDDQEQKADHDHRTADILEEVLELVRRQQKFLHSPQELFPEEYIAHVLRRADRGLLEHPAFSELLSNWHEFQAVIRSFEEEATVPTSVIRDFSDRLRTPIEFIARQSRTRRKFSRTRPDDET